MESLGRRHEHPPPPTLPYPKRPQGHETGPIPGVRARERLPDDPGEVRGPGKNHQWPSERSSHMALRGAGQAGNGGFVMDEDELSQIRGRGMG